MVNPLVGAGKFLIETLFDLYIMTVILRFLLQVVRADFYNPISQFLVTATNPLLVPLRRVIPGYAGVDTAAIVLMLALQSIKFILLSALFTQTMPALLGLLLLAVASTAKSITNIYFFAIIIQAVSSWIAPGSYNPVLGVLQSLTEPVMAPARRVIPPIGGLDISPLLVLIVLQLINMVAVDTLLFYGYVLSL